MGTWISSIPSVVRGRCNMGQGAADQLFVGAAPKRFIIGDKRLRDLYNLIDEISRRTAAFTDRSHVSRQISQSIFQGLFHIFLDPTVSLIAPLARAT